MKRFILRDKEIAKRAAEYICSLPVEDVLLEVVVRPHRRKRSVEQNALLWKWYGIIGWHLGYEKDEIHDLMRYKFLGMRAKDVCGHRIEYLPSTTKLTVKEMADYMDSVARFAARLGIRLPAEETDV